MFIGVHSWLGYSTAENLVKFSVALLNNKLVSAKTLETLWAGRLAYGEKDSKYGCGFIVKEYNGTRNCRPRGRVVRYHQQVRSLSRSGPDGGDPEQYRFGPERDRV